MSFKSTTDKWLDGIANSIVNNITHNSVNNMRKKFKLPKMGKTYIFQYIREFDPYREHQAGYHKASAPGEPPAVLSGRLYNSIKLNINYNIHKGVILSDTPYADLLEQGGVNENGYYVAPRPFIQITVEKCIEDLLQNGYGRIPEEQVRIEELEILWNEGLDQYMTGKEPWLYEVRDNL